MSMEGLMACKVGVQTWDAINVHEQSIFSTDLLTDVGGCWAALGH
jgi:hypothetical protein